jgi:hypothetical protein
MSARPAEFRTDISEWSRAVAEMLALARCLPDGLDRLKAFTSGPRHFCDRPERIEGGCVIVAVVPSEQSLAFLAELRAAAQGRAA